MNKYNGFLSSTTVSLEVLQKEFDFLHTKSITNPFQAIWKQILAFPGPHCTSDNFLIESMKFDGTNELKLNFEKKMQFQTPIVGLNKTATILLSHVVLNFTDTHSFGISWTTEFVGTLKYEDAPELTITMNPWKITCRSMVDLVKHVQYDKIIAALDLHEVMQGATDVVLTVPQYFSTAIAYCGTHAKCCEQRKDACSKPKLFYFEQVCFGLSQYRNMLNESIHITNLTLNYSQFRIADFGLSYSLARYNSKINYVVTRKFTGPFNSLDVIKHIVPLNSIPYESKCVTMVQEISVLYQCSASTIMNNSFEFVPKIVRLTDVTFNPRRSTLVVNILQISFQYEPVLDVVSEMKYNYNEVGNYIVKHPNTPLKLTSNEFNGLFCKDIKDFSSHHSLSTLLRMFFIPCTEERIPEEVRHLKLQRCAIKVDLPRQKLQIIAFGENKNKFIVCVDVNTGIPMYKGVSLVGLPFISFNRAEYSDVMFCFK